MRTNTTFASLSIDKQQELEHAEWLRTFMTKVENRNDLFEHTTPDGKTYRIERTPEYNWELTTEGAKPAVFARRKDAVHTIARETAQRLHDAGREVGKWSLELERKQAEAAKKAAEQAAQPAE